MLVFLALNNIELEYTQEELAHMFFKIASNEKTYEELLKWIIAHQIKITMNINTKYIKRALFK